MKIPRLSRTSDFLLSKLSSFHGASRVSYISWLVQFPFIRRVHLYLLPSYLLRRCNISPLFSQSFILVPLLFLVHRRSLHYHPRFFEHTRHSNFFFFSFPFSFYLAPHMFYHRTRMRSHICVFSSILRGYRTTTLFFSPTPRSLVLNFLRCGFATSIRHLHFDHFLFITSSPTLRIFYRRPLHLYNPAVPFFYPYCSFFFPSRSSYPSHLFLFHLPRLAPSASPPRSPSCSRYSRSCLQLI